jgi:hypothetical protein
MSLFCISFLGSAATIIASFEGILEEKIAAITAFGVTITATAVSNNSTWPFVTIDQFQQRSASSLSLSGCLFLELAPIVTDENRLAWEEYSVANTAWLTEGRAYQAEKGLGTMVGGDPYVNRQIVTTIDASSTVVMAEPAVSMKKTKHRCKTSPGNSLSLVLFRNLKAGPYFPIWQSSPIMPSPLDIVNFNMGTLPQYGQFVTNAASTGQIVLGGLHIAPAGGVSDPNPLTMGLAHIFSFHAGKQVNYTGEPLSTVFVPILDSFTEDRKTVAVLVANLRWASYLENILTDSTQPIRVVLSNTFQETFTYEIRGSQATLVGKGNLANRKYDDMAISVDFDETQIIIEPNTISLTLNQDLCRYTLHIYPTPEGDDYHNDAFPLMITLTVAAVFLMTATVFYFYDVMVEKRQKVILDTAQRSTAIVSSIFPKNVRDQLLQAPVQGNATKLRFLADARKQDTEAGVISPINIDVASGPIADLFPNCTGKLHAMARKLFRNGNTDMLGSLYSHVCRRGGFHSLVISPRTLPGLYPPGDSLCRV